MHLPALFCWTRFGAEAGQSFEQILRRKEEERRSNNGVFLWGIGNAVGPGIRELVQRCGAPEVLFSPIAGAAKRVDVAPESVVAWSSGETYDGMAFNLPAHSLVTSRQSASSPKVSHYALVCSCTEPLLRRPSVGSLAFNDLRNLLSGSQVGASQVTAVVTRNGKSPVGGRVYDVALRAQLVYPYLIRLRHPVALPGVVGSDEDWAAAVESVWRQRTHHDLTHGQQALPL
jgi:hypothetical protein